MKTFSGLVAGLLMALAAPMASAEMAAEAQAAPIAKATQATGIFTGYDQESKELAIEVLAGDVESEGLQQFQVAEGAAVLDNQANAIGIDTLKPGDWITVSYQANGEERVVSNIIKQAPPETGTEAAL